MLPLCAQAQQSEPAQSADCDPDTQNCPNVVTRAFGVVKDFVSSPLRWTSTDWLYFGGAVAAVGVAHQFDSNVRTHFVGNGPSAIGGNQHSLQDAIPAAMLFVGTWGYAELIDDSDGRREAGAMLQAAVLSFGPANIMKYATGRKGPYQTSSPNQWWSGGSSFPSEHTNAAFAIGTVLAESGNGEYRWVRRFLGYGVGGFTAYERLKHNAHWLSDTVAGSALGAASARFAMSRQARGSSEQDSGLALTPIPHGVALRYQRHLPW